MNTTALIEQWSMKGARRDLAGRFRSADEIRAHLLGASGPGLFQRRPFSIDESHGENLQPRVDAVGESQPIG